MTYRPHLDRLIGRVAVVSSPIPADGRGTVWIDGQEWTARQEGLATGPLGEGQRVLVLGREAATLLVMPEGPVS